MPSIFERVVTESEPENVKPLSSGKSGALLATYRGGLRAVLKPAKDTMPNGNHRQRGISVRTHPVRERAYYVLSKLLGFDNLVPETVLVTYKNTTASAQIFVPAVHLHDINAKLKETHAPDWRAEVVKTALLIPKRYWRQLLALDIIAGARDRHAHNVGIMMKIENEEPVYRLVAWDNAVTFGLTFARYHNVFHKFMFRTSVDFDSVWPALDGIALDDLKMALEDLLTLQEIEHAYRRLTFFRDDFPYRLPWHVCSQGTDEPAEFPPYEAYFSNASIGSKQSAIST